MTTTYVRARKTDSDGVQPRPTKTALLRAFRTAFRILNIPHHWRKQGRLIVSGYNNPNGLPADSLIGVAAQATNGRWMWGAVRGFEIDLLDTCGRCGVIRFNVDERSTPRFANLAVEYQPIDQ